MGITVSCDAKLKMKKYILSILVVVVLTASASDGIASSRLINLSRSSSNLTDFTPGAAFCPETKLRPPLKQNSIFIGLVGSNIDPLFAILEEEDTPINENGTNCYSGNIDICPLPGMKLAMYAM